MLAWLQSKDAKPSLKATLSQKLPRSLPEIEYVYLRTWKLSRSFIRNDLFKSTHTHTHKHTHTHTHKNKGMTILMWQLLHHFNSPRELRTTVLKSVHGFMYLVSAAITWAMRLLPHPLGPYKRIPETNPSPSLKHKKGMAHVLCIYLLVHNCMHMR